MFLADWSGRRVAGYAILWLVGFPIVTTAFAIMGEMSATGSGGFTVGMPDVEVGAPAVADSVGPAGSIDTVYVDPAITVDTARLRARFDQVRPGRQLAFLPGQPSDLRVSLAVHEVTDVDTGFDWELLPGLLPPALLVAAWAWTRRSRPDAG